MRPARSPEQGSPANGPDADPREVAREIALRQLEVRPRTRRELRDTMARRQIAEDIVDEVLDRLCEVGLIDDEAFAHAWVESRHRGKNLGRRALAAELYRKGVDPDTAADAVAAVTIEDEEAVAKALVERKLRSMDRLDDAAKVRRLGGMLARKGIPESLSRQVIIQAIEAARLSGHGAMRG